jgi:16S rRNA (guanine966-N2)-methyltransferase
MSGLRVISGSARGRRLLTVPGDTTRPITDRTKEALFDIIGGDIRDSNFLDLFAGTGSVGIEALSRGAKFAKFLDLHPLAIRTIRVNLSRTELVTKAEVQKQDAFKYLVQTPDYFYDYLYIAPPQYKGYWKQTLLIIDSHLGWLCEYAWVIVQIHPIEYELLNLTSLIEFDQRKYGSTLLVFYNKKIG